MKLKQLFKSKQAQQSFVLLIGSLVTMVLTLLINYFLTKIMDKENFGNYSLIINIYAFSQIIFNFGFYYSIGRIVAVSSDSIRQRQIYGAGLIYTLGIFLLMAICLLVYAFVSLSDNKVVFEALLISLPFGWAYLLIPFFENILQGNNRINLLATSRVFPKLVFLIALVSIFLSKVSVDLNIVIVIFFISSIIAYSYVMFRLKPLFTDLKGSLKEVNIENKAYGFNIYLGSVLSVGASSLAGILISTFGVNNIEVGYYTIALQLAAPMTLIPNILGISFFRNFVNDPFISKKLLLSTSLLSFFSLIFVLILAHPLIIFIYGKEYIDSVILLKYLSIGSIFYGMSDFLNKFLQAKGKGKELRNASFLVGITLLLSNFILIKIDGARGAALSKVLAGLIYFFTILHYYSKVIKQSSTLDS